MILRCLLYLIFFLPFNLSAQSLQWLRSYGGNNIDESVAVATDIYGNVFTAGEFSDTADFDPGPGTFNLSSTGDIDAFISKVDSQGNFVWAKQLTGSWHEEAQQIITDAAGSVIVTGSFDSLVDFDPGPGSFYLTATPLWSAFILKLDSSGNFVWAKSIQGVVINGSATDEAGNLYFTGAFSYTVDFDPGPGIYNLSSSSGSDAFVLKLSSSGQFIWAKAMGGPDNDFATSVGVDKNYNIYTTGQYKGVGDFDPDVSSHYLTANGTEYDIFLSKLDSSGAFVWVKSIGGTALDAVSHLALDTTGNVCITGAFHGPSDFDPGTGINNLVSGFNLSGFLAKYDTSGALMWAKAFQPTNSNSGYSYPSSLAIGSSGKIYITGGFNDSTDFDPGPGSYILATPAADHDCFVGAYESSGNFLWATSSGGSTAEWGSGLAIDKAENVYVTGLYLSPSFTYGVATVTNTNPVNSDAFLFKVGPCTTAPAQASAIAGQTTVCSGTDNLFSVPNVNGASSYIWTLPPGWTGSSSSPAITVIPGATGGTVSVTVVNNCGASPAQSISVTVVPPAVASITPSGPILFCAGDSALLTTNTGTGYSFQWQNNGIAITGATSSAYTAMQGGIYTVSIDNGACADTSSPVQVTASVSAPVIQQTGNTLNCSGAFATYQWYLGGSPIPGATAQTFVATQDGNYHVEVTNVDGCPGTSNPLNVVVNTIVNVMREKHLVVSPNPATYHIKIIAPDAGWLQLYTSEGKLVSTYKLQGGENRITLSAGMAAGLYILSFTSSVDGRMLSGTFVVER